MDNIFVINNIPEGEEKEVYSQLWIKEQIIKVINKHGARVLNPQRDIVFPQKGLAVCYN